MIAIKNMEMPDSCYDCHFAVDEESNDYGSFCKCGILNDYETINLLEHSKHLNCPLVEIITCKDCEHNDEGSCDMDGCGVTDDCYCYCAYRRERG